MAELIGNVVITPKEPRPGQSVRVEILSPSGDPLGDKVQATIDGIPGSSRYLQFPTPGTRRLVVRVVDDGQTDQRTATVNIDGPPIMFHPHAHTGGAELALMHARRSQTSAYEVEFTLGAGIPGGAEGLGGGGGFRTDTPPALFVRGRQSTSARGALGRAVIEAAEAPARSTRRFMSSTRRPGRRQLTSTVFELGATDLRAQLEKAHARPRVVQTRYEWDFGDGTTAVTETPSVSHDFFPSTNHADGLSHFDVRCRVVHDDVTAIRTLTLRSAYAMCRQRGTIVPHVTAGIFARKEYWLFRAELQVHNVEDVPLVLDRMAVAPITEDPDALATPPASTAMSTAVTVSPHSSTVVGVNVSMYGEVPYDAPGFTVWYGGHAGGIPVRVSATFEVPVAERSVEPFIPKPDMPDLEKKTWPWEEVEIGIDRMFDPLVREKVTLSDVVVDRVTGTVGISLGNVTGADMAPVRTTVDRVMGAVVVPGHEMAVRHAKLPAGGSLQNPPRISKGPALVGMAPSATTLRPGGGLFRSVGGHTGAGVLRFAGPPSPGPLAEGQICDPDNLTEEELAQASTDQLVCQLSTEEQEVLMPARFMNARKGDIILSPGGTGLVGTLLRAVDPPQSYSHSGIMTRNYDEITHSTASEARLHDYLLGISDGSDGIEPRVLKYMWPGVVAQSVEAAIHGEPFTDPENGKSYSISSFSPHAEGVDQFHIVPPLVVKPDPLEETQAVRATLHGVAADARTGAGRPGVNSKSHYRLFCYTDPIIGLSSVAPSSAGWAAGTSPSVCSSYIWAMLKKRGVHLEADTTHAMPSDLEQSDKAAGASVDPGTRDGLYSYTASERRHAADVLYEKIHHEVFDDAGWFGNLLTDAADDVANQLLNAFASDEADGKDSDAWKNTKSASAVSPDNILFWDGPQANGLYGFAEPLLYREPRKETYTVSRWKKVLTRGTISGRVTYQGVPRAGILVQVYEGKSAMTNATGHYTLLDVPFGSYYLKASGVIDGMLASAQVHVDLQTPKRTVEVALQPPAERYRLAQVYVDFRGKDDETEGDLPTDPPPQYFELELGPDKPVNSRSFSYKWGGELRCEYTVIVRLLVTNTIDVEVQGWLYEGGSENNTDLDGQGSLSFNVPLEQTGAAHLVITNTQEDDDDDRGELTVSVKNAQNTN